MGEFKMGDLIDAGRAGLRKAVGESMRLNGQGAVVARCAYICARHAAGDAHRAWGACVRAEADFDDYARTPAPPALVAEAAALGARFGETVNLASVAVRLNDDTALTLRAIAGVFRRHGH